MRKTFTTLLLALPLALAACGSRRSVSPPQP